MNLHDRPLVEAHDSRDDVVGIDYTATCPCGWRGRPRLTVPEALTQWTVHALEEALKRIAEMEANPRVDHVFYCAAPGPSGTPGDDTVAFATQVEAEWYCEMHPGCGPLMIMRLAKVGRTPAGTAS